MRKYIRNQFDVYVAFENDVGVEVERLKDVEYFDDIDQLISNAGCESMDTFQDENALLFFQKDPQSGVVTFSDGEIHRPLGQGEDVTEFINICRLN